MKPYELRNAWRRLGCLLALAGGALTAHAYDAALGAVRSEFAANQTINTATHFTNAWTPSANGVDGVKIGRNFTMKAPGGRAVTGALEASMGRQAAGKLLARALAQAVPFVGTAALAYTIYDAVRVRENANGEGLGFDPGTAPATGTVNVTEYFDALASNVPSRYSESLSGACTASMTLRPLCTSDSTKTCTSQSVTGTSGSVRCNYQYSFTVIGGPDFQQCNNTVPKSCNQNRTDVRDMATRVVAKQTQTCSGAPATSFDGRCPTGQYGEAITPEEAESKRRLAEDAGKLPRPTSEQIAQAISEVTQQIPVPIHDDYAPQAADVPNVAGGTTKVTAPDGTTTQTAVAWDFKPYGLTKGFGFAASGGWDKETTTTTCPGGGTQCTTETTKEETDPQTKPGEGDDPEADFCKSNPNRAGCVELGDMPTDQVPRTTLQLAYSTETIGLPSGCPPDVPMPRGQVFSYASTCDTLTKMRPLVIVAGAFTALLICIGAMGGHKGAA